MGIFGLSEMAFVREKLVQAIRVQKGTEEDLDLLIRPEGQYLIDHFAMMLARAPRTVFPLLIDYRRVMSVMVTNGKYDYVDHAMTQDYFRFNRIGFEDRVIDAQLNVDAV